MKVSVCARVTYEYEAEIPDGVDIEIAADNADPVYPRFMMALINEGLNYDGKIVSIIDVDTEKVLYLEE